MAFTRSDTKTNYISELLDLPNDQQGLTAAQLKAKFDQAGTDLKNWINNVLLPALESTVAGSSGASNIGATAITDLDGTTVQALLESLRNKLKSTTLNASGADFVNSSGVSGLTGNTVQALLNALKSYIDTHKTSSDHDARYYTETETDTKLNDLAGVGRTTETIKGNADAINTHKTSADHDGRYYTKTQLDTKVSSVNGAIASVDGVINPTGNIDLVAGTGISITPDNTAKTITITATGTALPAAHASTHASGGTDPVTPASIGAETPAGAQAKVDTHANASDPHPQYALDSDLNSHLADYVRQPAFAVTSGTSTAYTVSTNPAPTAYVDGMGITIVPHVDCGISPTLNWNGLGAILLKKQTGETYGAGELKANTPYSFKKVGTSFLADSSGGLDEFFGDGSDGAFNSSGNVTILVTSNTGVAIKQYTSFTLNAGHVLTTDNPCRGLVIFCQGDVVISGTIDMSKKATIGSGEVPILPITKVSSLGAATIDKYLKLTTVLQVLKGGAGGNGGNGGYGQSSSYPGGTGGSGGAGRVNLGGFGGGGGGGAAGSYPGGNGGSISNPDIGLGYNAGGFTGVDEIQYWHSINGGGGGGSLNGGSKTLWHNGTGICYGGGGGGQGARAGIYALPACNNGEYAGGFVLIICRGNITINSGGYIKANGGNGGNGVAAAGGLACGGGGGGGGSGGGVIAIFYKGTYTNNGTLQVNGGLGGSGGSGVLGGQTGYAGTSGSAGIIHVQQL